ncbi:MAG: hypothetical protein ACT4QG_08040 [Sporichthyaceae bacterium]
MTFYYDLDARSWAVEEDVPAPGRSWLAAAAGCIVLAGSIAAAAALQVLA